MTDDRRQKMGFTPLEKAADFNRRSLRLKVDGGLMPTSAQTVSPPRRIVSNGIREHCSLTGFTIVEVLTVLAIMALLVGILLPALNMARNAARTAKQRVRFVSIEEALLAWRNDFGEYPPSKWDPSEPLYYCGAQKLAEALLGRDLLGFHRDSVFRSDGFDATGTIDLYPMNPDLVNLSKRKSRYLELETANAFRIRDVFQNNFWKLNPDTYVLCDEFGRFNVALGSKIVKVGMPILYYKADPSKIGFSGNPMNCVYNSYDNFHVAFAAQQNEPEQNHPLASGTGMFFYDSKYKVLDPKVVSKPWPHRPDSYILISAGIDGLYGTADDITNFGY